MAQLTERDRAYLAECFGIPADTIVSHNSGAAYDSIIVKDRASAEKVREAVKGETCNGGYFHGMALGGITELESGTFYVMC